MAYLGKRGGPKTSEILRAIGFWNFMFYYLGFNEIPSHIQQAHENLIRIAEELERKIIADSIQPVYEFPASRRYYYFEEDESFKEGGVLLKLESVQKKAELLLMKEMNARGWTTAYRAMNGNNFTYDDYNYVMEHIIRNKPIGGILIVDEHGHHYRLSEMLPFNKEELYILAFVGAGNSFFVNELYTVQGRYIIPCLLTNEQTELIGRDNIRSYPYIRIISEFPRQDNAWG